MHDLVVELLPARHGDAILLEWPDPSSVDRPIRRMLIDCGPAPAYTGIANRLRELESRHIDLLVLTHIDADHIEGMILAVNDADLGLDIGEVWFNGYPQQLTPARRYLFSTDSGYSGHPDDTAVASVIRYGKCGAELVFNYSNPQTRQWNSAELREQYGYTARYPEAGVCGIRVGG